ncbi:PIN domain-like protein [Dentipellis sp. KUC8613]|nr:PIN domain-like protein [Dentipellis sp. KUC8613]
MGISGLLPLLKSIQVQKHLSEFSGQTLAVDGYVWLHRGTYACATELATGKATTKYVEYAMGKVRLLRHHGIHPYLVFDGGPLPAKRGTEKERRQRRQENLAKGNALAAQGKQKEAREYYCKCVDVTPQMAFQLIKALRAADVPYIVAPYEADAQLAYLERIGVVDGIITEDSDLLVFGCKHVLTKLDPVAATLVAISRDDFASVDGHSGGLSLRGWSDVEFRAMAILSGCDYLPSIQGVGLKTAWQLLKKHRTAENAIRALRLEGKKNVPKGYLEAFKLAEKVFLHQRVYCPFKEKLVHLTAIPTGETWNPEHEAYIGEHMEPTLAKKVALGEADPVSRLPMEDINPSYTPRTVKPLPLASNDINRSAKGKERMPAKSKSEATILQFLGEFC